MNERYVLFETDISMNIYLSIVIDIGVADCIDEHSKEQSETDQMIDGNRC